MINIDQYNQQSQPEKPVSQNIYDEVVLRTLNLLSKNMASQAWQMVSPILIVTKLRFGDDVMTLFTKFVNVVLKDFFPDVNDLSYVVVKSISFAIDEIVNALMSSQTIKSKIISQNIKLAEQMDKVREIAYKTAVIATLAVLEEFGRIGRRQGQEGQLLYAHILL